MSLEHFDKHLACNTTLHERTMHEHRKMPQYMFKMPQGANTYTHRPNGTQPNQNFENILLKNHKPNPFFENPQF